MNTELTEDTVRAARRNAIDHHVTTVYQAITLVEAWLRGQPNATPVMIVDGVTTFYNGLKALGTLETEQPIIAKATSKQIKDSIKPDGLVSFEDGKTYKSLKRHLTKRGLTPDEYRAKWGLPADYAMVSEEYSARRSELAKANGLGRK